MINQFKNCFIYGIQGLPINTYIEPDLPLELLQQGWKKFWSKRENRPYFWNKLTGESLWEFPPLRQQVCIKFENVCIIHNCSSN